LRKRAAHARPSGNLEIPAAVTGGRLAVPLGHIQRDRLRCSPQLRLRVSMPLDAFTEAIRPPSVLDGRAIYVKSLVATAHGIALDSDTDTDADADADTDADPDQSCRTFPGQHVS
jgi:hypothetical protein